MSKSWVLGHWHLSVYFKRGYWRWEISQYGSKTHISGKDKDRDFAISDALDELSVRSQKQLEKD